MLSPVAVCTEKLTLLYLCTNVSLRTPVGDKFRDGRTLLTSMMKDETGRCRLFASITAIRGLLVLVQPPTMSRPPVKGSVGILFRMPVVPSLVDRKVAPLCALR